jgi:hypothetical protein
MRACSQVAASRRQPWLRELMRDYSDIAEDTRRQFMEAQK